MRIVLILWVALLPWAHASLWQSIRADNVSALNPYLQQGAAIGAISPEGHPPIIQAIRDRSPQVLARLLHEPGLDVDQPNVYGETPLMYAALANDMPLAQRLFDRGASINRFGWTPLHYASIKGNEAMVQWLLDKGAWLNVQSPEGHSALFYALRAGKIGTAQRLLQAGALPNAITEEQAQLQQWLMQYQAQGLLQDWLK